MEIPFSTLSETVSHFLPLIPLWVTGKLVPISSSLLAGGGVHPGQVASPSQGNTQTTMHTLIHTPKGNLERPMNLKGLFLDWEEAGVPGENSHMHGENMQTPCRKTPTRESNRCKATVLPTVSPCSHHLIHLLIFAAQ
ncbi:hypothetical protein AMECASPLE_004812 [Ameca splendens]|uniref:Uncharacterized protein n=1 Tax=Ameca splendens TaxID=208324 RepID=A0ABV0YKZ6_9TELE